MALPAPSPAIAGIEPYRVPRHGAPMDLMLDGIGGLSAPTTLFTDALAGLTPDQVLRNYPDTAPLAAAFAARHGIGTDQVLVTGGGDDALDRAIRSLLAPGRTMVLPEPTFEMLHRYTQWTGGTYRSVPWPDGPYPVQAVLAQVDATTTAVAVVSPNNPTGGVISSDALRTLAAGCPDAVLLLDHAYVEFADEDLTELALTLPNVLVFRTMSKAWGLAGLRVGYVVGPAPLIQRLRAAGNPYTVSAPSVAITRHRLDTGQAEVDAYIDTVRAQRDQLAALLTEVGARPQGSQANFVFARSDRALWVRDGLAGLGIAVRVWPGHAALADALRLNVPGEADVFARVEAGLRAVLAPEALLLDMDGVLADVSGSYRRAILDTAARFGAHVTSDDVHAAKDAGGANNDWVLTQRLMAARGVVASLDEVTRVFEAIYQGENGEPGLKHTEAFIGGAALLRSLAARFPIAIVTGRPRADAIDFLTRHGVDDVPRALVCMEDAPAKPDPEPVRLALEALGVRSAWMVGDTPDDVRAARAAGVVPLGVVPPGASFHHTARVLTAAGAARVLPDISHLPEVLP